LAYDSGYPLYWFGLALAVLGVINRGGCGWCRRTGLMAAIWGSGFEPVSPSFFYLSPLVITGCADAVTRRHYGAGAWKRRA
jgi:hypothetical protein